MSDGIAIQITGFNQFADFIKDLNEPMRKKILTAAARKATKPVITDLQGAASAHERTGALKRALGFTLKFDKATSTVVDNIGVQKGAGEIVSVGSGKHKLVKPGRYFHLLEGGHRIARGGKLAQTIISKRGKVYHYKGTGGTVTGKVEGHPFLERVVQSDLPEWSEEFSLGCFTEFDKAYVKAAKKVAKMKIT